jgi:hypothetical protein
MTAVEQQALALGEPRGFEPRFVVCRNPDPESSLPYVLRLPAGRGLVLKAADCWPVASRVYCHPLERWPAGELELVADVPVRMCAWRGPALDLVLDRARHNRSQFVWTRARGREAIFWQTADVVRRRRPGVRIPRVATGPAPLPIEIDTREQRPYAFAGRPIDARRTALFAGDYAVRGPDGVVAAVERKTFADYTTSLTSGALGFAMADLSPLPAAAVVVEECYSALFKDQRTKPGWLAILTARLQVRHSVPIVFAESRKLAEEWTYRFLAAAAAEYGGGGVPR